MESASSESGPLGGTRLEAGGRVWSSEELGTLKTGELQKELGLVLSLAPASPAPSGCLLLEGQPASTLQPRSSGAGQARLAVLVAPGSRDSLDNFCPGQSLWVLRAPPFLQIEAPVLTLSLGDVSPVLEAAHPGPSFQLIHLPITTWSAHGAQSQNSPELKSWLTLDLPETVWSLTAELWQTVGGGTLGLEIWS